MFLFSLRIKNIILEYILISHLFLTWMGVEFFKYHLSIYGDDPMILILSSNNTMSVINGFPNREPLLGLAHFEY